MKYVVFEDDTAVLFPSWIEHVIIGTRLAPRCGMPVRAGFVRLIPKRNDQGSWIAAEVHGESLSLGLKSHPCDNELIEKVIKS